MKLFLFSNDEIDLFVNEYFFKNYNELNEINLKKIIKSVVGVFQSVYDYKMVGFYDINIFFNKKIGAFIKFKKIDNYLNNNNTMDARIKVFDNSVFYFKTEDYFIIKDLKNILYDNNYYYIDIKYLKNINKYVEFGDFVSKDCIKDNLYLLNKKV